MELQIRNIRGRIEVIGNFTATNVYKVKDHVNYLLDHYEEVVMCLAKVKKMDQKAMIVLKNVYAKAQKRSKVLFVLGKENKEIFKALQNNQLTYIFKNDY